MKDLVPHTVCELDVPGLKPWGAGWFLIAANGRVECGPFGTDQDARAAAAWLDDEARGVYPGPWTPRFSGIGLMIGSRARTRRADRVSELS